jgi:hypothetical protein
VGLGTGRVGCEIYTKLEETCVQRRGHDSEGLGPKHEVTEVEVLSEKQVPLRDKKLTIYNKNLTRNLKSNN